jgi:hypothetical protein
MKHDDPLRAPTAQLVRDDMRLLQQLKLLMGAALMFAAAPSAVFATNACTITQTTRNSNGQSAVYNLLLASPGPSSSTKVSFSATGLQSGDLFDVWAWG